MFVCFDALCHSKQFFSHVGMISCLPEIKCLAHGHKTVTARAVSLKLETL